MPNPLQAPWNDLIPLIPVGDHAVRVRADIWLQPLQEYGLEHFHVSIFGNSASVALTRSRLITHAYADPVQKSLEIFLWGYPTGGRGNLKTVFLQNFRDITRYAALDCPWQEYYSSLHDQGGLGISTISKLAYFHGRIFGGHAALILDSRLIEALSHGRWAGLSMPGLTYANASARYPEYLQLLSGVAEPLGCQPDHIEFLLFAWGDSFC